MERGKSVPILIAVVALTLIIICWWQVWRSEAGLIKRTLLRESVPLTFLVRKGEANVPGVVVAHGFAGSRQLMVGYAHVLAQAGYGVMLLDIDGHGGNGRPLQWGSDTLQANLDAAYAELVVQPEVDGDHIALLGHSMGSGAVMSAGIRQAERYQATVAISPTDAQVTADRPRNLLLQAGTLEPPFLANAQRLLARAGGANENIAEGLARRLVVIPNVEHITILFSSASHQAALSWLDEVFGRETAVVYRDSRFVWYLAHLASWLVLAVAIAPLLPVREAEDGRTRRNWLGLIIGPLLAAIVVSLLNRPFDLSSLGGMLISGALAIWFLLFGLGWLLAASPIHHIYIPKPSRNDLIWGMVLFGFLSLAFGALAQLTWLPWMMNTPRLLRWPLLAAAVLPWQLASGAAQQGLGWRGRLWHWLAQSIAIVFGLALMVALTPDFSFVLLLLPLMPVILAVLGIGGYMVKRLWAVALGNGLFFGWLLAAVFPLV